MAQHQHSPGFLKIVDDAKSRVRQMNVDEYGRLRDSGAPHLPVDVREDHEWSAAHARGAAHLGKDIIERDIERTVPDKSATLALYCGGRYRSVLAADALRKMGYTGAVSLAGGWRAWQAAGLPLETPGSPDPA